MKQIILLILILVISQVLAERVDQIENGIIESHVNSPSMSSPSQLVYTVKCNKYSQLNSNSSLVYQFTSANNTTKWLPVNGFLYSNLPLCLHVCRFQSRLTNGVIKIDTLADLKNNTSNTKQSLYYVDLIESSKIKYECADGYFLRVIPNSRQQTRNDLAKGRKYLIERCKSNGVEDFVVVKRKSKVFLTRHDYNFEDYYDEYSSDERHDEYYFDRLDTMMPSSNLASLNEKKLYECTRYCRPFKLVSLMYGYLVPSKQNTQFSPGEQVKFYCKEGYVTDLTKTRAHVSNMHLLECTTNGTWNLVLNTNRFPSTLFKHNIDYLTDCNPIDTFYETSQTNKSDSYLTYSELNMRTFTMIFAICGLIILVLLTSLLTLKLIKRKHPDIVFNNMSPQLDPLLTTNSDANSTLPEYTIRSRTIMPTIIPSAPSLHLSTSELPTYQEAVNQPNFLPPTNQSVLISSNVERIASSNEPNIKVEEQPSNQMRSNQQWDSGMARSGSVRSNLTTRSANGSIRTTNSIATTNSVGNASFNIPLPHRSTRSASKHNNNQSTSKSASKRHANSNKTTTRSTNSAISEACTVLTTTNMSLMSNETNASVKVLRGSSSGVDLTSTNSGGSYTSINNNNNPSTSNNIANNNGSEIHTNNNIKTDTETLVIDESNLNKEQNSTN